MFSKRVKPQSRSVVQIAPLPPAAQIESPPARKAPPKVASLISADITVEGGVNGDG